MSVTVCNAPESGFNAYIAEEPDLIIIDLHMPRVNGVEFMQRVRQSDHRAEYVPFFFITSDQRPESKRKALQAGAADIVDKFVDEVDLLLRVSNLLKMRHLHRQIERYNAHLELQVLTRTEELNASQREILERLAIASEYRDDQTASHVDRVGNLSAAIAEVLGLSEGEIEVIRLAAKLHDVGKIGISDTILYKPGPLTTEERSVMQQHATIGERILSNGTSKLVQTAATIAGAHHERWDGQGYPNRLKGEEIPLVGRIVAVADVYDALITERPYKRAVPPDQARDIVASESGRHFDPGIVEAFLFLSKEYAFNSA